MDYLDVTPVMVTGETRVMLPGKILIQVLSSGLPVPFVKAPDIAIVALGEDRKAIDGDAVCSRAAWGVSRSYCRLVTDFTDGPLWYGCLLEINTFNVPDDVISFVFVVDGLGKGVKAEDLVLLVEDGISQSHNSVFHGSAESRSAILAMLYRHNGDWKLRTQSLFFSDDRSAICAQFGIQDIWTSKIDRRKKSKQSRGNPISPSLSSPPVERSIAAASAEFKPIDFERLSSLERDTAAVAALLTDVFGTASPTSAVHSNTVSDTSVSSSVYTPHGLTQSQWKLIEYVMTSERITHGAFNQKAKELNELPSGAVTVINDWAFDLLGDVVLIDMGDEYSFNEDLRRAVEAL
jgi:hypothetical protein